MTCSRKHAERLHAMAWAGVILDEAHFIKNNSAAHLALPEAARRLDRRPRSADRSRPGLPPDRHADDQPPARPLQPAALRRPPGGAQLHRFRAALLRRLPQRLGLGDRRRLQPRGAEPPHEGGHAAPDEGRGARPAAQDPLLGAGRDRQPRGAQCAAHLRANGSPRRMRASPNDKAFLARLTKLRVALHKAKHEAVDRADQGRPRHRQKVIVFTASPRAYKRHAQTFGDAASRSRARTRPRSGWPRSTVSRPTTPCVSPICNLIAGGVGLTLTAGNACHLPGPRLGAGEPPARPRTAPTGWARRERVTVEYMLADGTLDVYIADLLETKLRLISAVEADEPPDGSMLDDLYNRLRALGPALLQENRIASGSAAVLERLEELAATTPRAPESPLLSGGVQEFRSSRDPKAVYRVTFGRTGHLECTCEGFRWRGNCKHVREVREAAG